MKAALLYGSTHGKTRKVAGRVTEQLRIKPDVFDVKSLASHEVLTHYDLLLFFCPNYGDEELQPDMEVFLAALRTNLEGKLFAICELGNYYGYDDFHLGAMPIIRRHLIGLQGRELCEPLSLDAFPRTNWGHLERWIDLLNRTIADNDRS
jgi:flavodoxin